MKCPNDSTTLVMSERGGVEIDYCPECRGVWLDRGELDKIVDRAESESRPATSAPAPSRPAPGYDEPRYGEPRYGDQRHDDRRGAPYGAPRKKKESWLSDLFD